MLEIKIRMEIQDNATAADVRDLLRDIALDIEDGNIQTCYNNCNGVEAETEQEEF